MGSVPTPPEMITPEEMAPRCGMSPENIRAALRVGKFPVGFAYKAPTKWRYYIPRAEFEDWLAGRIPSNQKEFARSVADRITEQILERAQGFEAVLMR